MLILVSGSAQLATGSPYVQVALEVDGNRVVDTYEYPQSGASRLTVPTMSAFLAPATAGAHPA